jgi:hypothetical protein
MLYPASTLSEFAYMQPWQVADLLIGLHSQYCQTFNLPADPDPIVSRDIMAANLRNTLTRQTKAILEYMYSGCGAVRLRSIITELANRNAYGVLRERDWLWQEAREHSAECREYANRCFIEQFNATLAELPRLV